jgi:2',3'-cyclic-nucleotide 2'-phosphodiesterase
MSETARAILIGDIIGVAGIRELKKSLPGLIGRFHAGLVVANGENAAAGFGLTKETADEMFAAGVDVITSGNHVWQKREFWPELEKNQRILRPANYPEPAVGHGLLRLEKDGLAWCVINLQGRENLYPIDCPFRTADRCLDEIEGDAIVLVDFHAESTEEKEALGLYLDGRVHGFVGTHTHVQTADERLLPKGTAYLSDLGMTGSLDSVIGMKTDVCISRSLTQMPLKMEVAEGPAEIRGAVIEIDTVARKAVSISRI